MNINDYEAGTLKTAMYKGIGTFQGVVYNALKLAGEAGEVADKIGKIYGKFGEDAVMTDEQKLELKKELGDCLYHLNRCGNDAGISLENIMKTNQEKLQSRYERNVIMDGSGDNR